MIKRRFYRIDHGDGSASSSSSSESSGSLSDTDSAAVHEKDDETEVELEEQENQATEISGDAFEEDRTFVAREGSGYDSECSSDDEIDSEAPVLILNEDHAKRAEEDVKHAWKVEESTSGVSDGASVGKKFTDPDDSVEADFSSCILKYKTIFKCKLCPRVMCLSLEMVRTHLKSKRHARSKKLFGEGRLKVMLNSDGELEEEQETHAERYARIMAAAAQESRTSKRDTGRQRQSRRRKKKARLQSNRDAGK